MPHEGWSGPWVPLMPIICLAFMAFFFFMFRKRGMMDGRDRVGNSQQPRGDNESPLDILKQRYANGAIAHDEFEKMKKSLEDEEEPGVGGST